MENPKDVVISLCMVSLVSGITGFILFRYTAPLATILCTISFVYGARALVYCAGGMWLKKTGKLKKYKIDISWLTLGVTGIISGVLSISSIVFLFLIASGLR